MLAIAVALLLCLVSLSLYFPPCLNLYLKLLFAGVHVCVLDSMLGCCEFALRNYFVAAEAATIGHAISCCWFEVLRIHVARAFG